MSIAQQRAGNISVPLVGQVRDVLRDTRCGLTCRRSGTVLILCFIFSTQVLAQPDLFEHWSFEQIVAGWSFCFAELTLTGFAMLGGLTLAEHISKLKGPGRAIAVGVALPASAALGYSVAVYVLYSPGFSILSLQYVGDTLRMTVLGGAMVLIDVLRGRSHAATKATHDTKVVREALTRQTLEARLQLMEAQVEPHFLFNSLANVQRLYETEPESGERLLSNLKTYLRAALPQMRDACATLGREADLSRAYLEVLQARMGERLRFAVDIPEGLREHAFPPMMVITLVENAIKHGIHHSPQGGAVVVRARSDGESLTVEVADTGVGFRSGSGKGIGLANIRARLGALFGEQAALSLYANEPSGVVAAIAVPIP